MKNIVVLVSLAVLLMACKDAPSDRDLKEVFTKAVGPHPAGLIENHGASIEIVAVKNTQCEQVSVEKYQCTFNITSKKIEKLEEGWESNEKLKVETMSRSYWLGDQIKELNEDIPFDERKKIYYSHKKQAEGLQA